MTVRGHPLIATPYLVHPCQKPLSIYYHLVMISQTGLLVFAEFFQLYKAKRILGIPMSFETDKTFLEQDFKQ